VDIKTQLEQEEIEATKRVTRKHKGESEKERLWDSMWKEDVRELGRRDWVRKRQKV
jgi:hypothetical protein